MYVVYNKKHNALEVYLPGCRYPCGACKDDFIDFSKGGENATTGNLARDFFKIKGINRIWIKGGEPCDQEARKLEKFMYEIWYSMLRITKDPELWLWTCRTPTTIPPQVKRLATHIKYGKHDPKYPPVFIPEYDLTLSSSNQKIIKQYDKIFWIRERLAWVKDAIERKRKVDRKSANMIARAKAKEKKKREEREREEARKLRKSLKKKKTDTLP